MIQANELRIGNWVYETRMFEPSPEDLSPIQIASINSIDNALRDTEDNIYTFEDIHPIPLTPEILEKAGFKKGVITSEVYYQKSPDFYLVSHATIRDYGFRFKYDNGVQVKHLHQLQNLYFALTGEELQISL